MKSVIFDFDSTLVSCESLDLMMEKKLSTSERIEYQAITEKGMNGECSFNESLQQRLSFCAPTKDDVLHFSKLIFSWITPEFDLLIKSLQAKSIQIWILSGGLRDIILPFAEKLAIPSERVCAVELSWNDDGTFSAIDNSNGFATSKVEGIKKLQTSWDGESCAVGDGITDYAIYKEGFVDDFVAFTMHKRREVLLQKINKEARSVQELREYLLGN
jgi:HAD superfamily phosphoserine phosphatase-like hydrolase